MEICARNTEGFRAISKSVQKVWNFLCDSEAFRFERALAIRLAKDDDDFYGGASATTWLCCNHIKVTSLRDHVKPKVVPTEGWHYKEFVGSEGGKGSTTLLGFTKARKILSNQPRGRSPFPSFISFFSAQHINVEWLRHKCLFCGSCVLRSAAGKDIRPTYPALGRDGSTLHRLFHFQTSFSPGNCLLLVT